MQLLDHTPHAIDLRSTPLHLGLGSRARAVQGFVWDPDVLAAYGQAVAADGGEGRMVMIFPGDGAGDHWERHPAGDEVVVCLSGSVTVIREDERVVLWPGEATVNPAGVWHAVDMNGPSAILTITPGVGTEHRPRTEGPPAATTAPMAETAARIG